IRRIFSTPMRAATKIGLGIDLSVTMMAWGRNPKIDPAAPRTSRLEGDLGNLLLLRLGARHDSSANRFVADRRRIPLREPPCRVWQVGEACFCLTPDARLFLTQNVSFV